MINYILLIIHRINTGLFVLKTDKKLLYLSISLRLHYFRYLLTILKLDVSLEFPKKKTNYQRILLGIEN